MDAALAEFGKTHPLWGVCAGSILIASKVSRPEQRSFNLIDMHAIRNFYGSQLNSFKTPLKVEKLGSDLSVDFIRAPKLEPLSDKVSVLALHNGAPVLLQQGKILASSFHVELGEDTKLHEYFAGL
jgi:pyridoxal 5'-phosphate synthase pdxT subunit